MAKLHFRYAAMNAGKSTALLQVAHNYEERGMKVRLFTAALDVRAGKGVIASRLGIAREAETFGADIACLLIDEAQFLSLEQVRQLHRLAHVDGVPVICYGLRSDFRAEAFAGAAALLTLADDIEEMKSVCACGRKATLNLRIDERGQRIRQGEQVFIGGNDRYRAICPSCFYMDDELGPDAAPGLFA